MSLTLQLCLEFVSNHISPASPQFKDFVEHGEASRYKNMFVRWEDIWPGGESAGGVPLSHSGPLCHSRCGSWPGVASTAGPGLPALPVLHSR